MVVNNGGYRPGVPDDWFVDPVRLGVPGVRQLRVVEEENPLAWQSDSLCAQTDPEAFFPEKGGSTRDAKKICSSCEVRSHCLEYALAASGTCSADSTRPWNPSMPPSTFRCAPVLPDTASSVYPRRRSRA
jgi:WhiB family redox-sensing transcriptional regulator